MRRNGIRRRRIVTRSSNTISLAVWDVPMPVVAGETFSIKVGAKSASGRALAGCRVEVSDASGAVVASATLGEAPLAGNRGAVLDRARRARAGPATSGRIRRAAHAGPASPQTQRRRGSASRSTAKPEHKLTVKVTERDTRGGARRCRNPARLVSRPHRRGRPRRTARLQGRVSASALAHRAYRASPADRHRGRRQRRAHDGARARGASGRALGEVSNSASERDPPFGEASHA